MTAPIPTIELDGLHVQVPPGFGDLVEWTWNHRDQNWHILSTRGQWTWDPLNEWQQADF